MLYKVVLTFKSVDETLVCVTIQMKAIEKYFHVVMFIMLYRVVLTYSPSVVYILEETVSLSKHG